MAAPANNTRRWVATLIVLLLALQAGNWLWRAYRRGQHSPPPAATALQRKIAASQAYANALLRANTLLDHQDTATAGRLLDSLRQQPTDSLFRIESLKLQAARQRLDSVRTGLRQPRPRASPSSTAATK